MMNNGCEKAFHSIKSPRTAFHRKNGCEKAFHSIHRFIIIVTFITLCTVTLITIIIIIIIIIIKIVIIISSRIDFNGSRAALTEATHLSRRGISLSSPSSKSFILYIITITITIIINTA